MIKTGQLFNLPTHACTRHKALAPKILHRMTLPQPHASLTARCMVDKDVKETKHPTCCSMAVKYSNSMTSPAAAAQPTSAPWSLTPAVPPPPLLPGVRCLCAKECAERTRRWINAKPLKPSADSSSGWYSKLNLWVSGRQTSTSYT